MTDASYTGRRSTRRDGAEHWAEVTVRASATAGETAVTLRPAVLDQLRATFGADFEHQRHCVWAAVAAQIDTANVAGQMPFVGANRFHAEVIDVRVSGDAGRKTAGFLLTMAGMDAIGAFLEAWEERARAEDPAPPGTVAAGLSVVGHPPPLAGRRCDALLVAEYWDQGRCVDPANGVHLCWDGRWHRLGFPCDDAAEWTSGGAVAGEPRPADFPEFGASSRVVDLAGPRGLVGVRLRGYTMEPGPRLPRATFEFADGRRLVFEHDRGMTTYRDA